ncbi:unnamed protein product [Caenorhabditis auriculariae]|uniref:Uncharacterized protein n=1 Tax=Caenorhabditis auriculariae TaxID=2777116 RepID=A0A8S1GN62_9PELO|nr:unnamed protein product [Caenorhabditis auriculariae]
MIRPYSRSSQGENGRRRHEMDFYRWYLSRAAMVTGGKYIILFLYFLRSFQIQLGIPLYCGAALSRFPCEASRCLWLHEMLVRMPDFLIGDKVPYTFCHCILVFCMTSVVMFLYAMYLSMCADGWTSHYLLKMILILPSIVFELGLSIFSFYAIIRNYTGQWNVHHETLFFILCAVFAVTLCLFTAFLIIVYFMTVFYIVDKKGQLRRNWAETSYSIARHPPYDGILRNSPFKIDPQVPLLSTTESHAAGHTDEAYNRLCNAMRRNGSSSDGSVQRPTPQRRNQAPNRAFSSGDVLSVTGASGRFLMDGSSTSDYGQLQTFSNTTPVRPARSIKRINPQNRLRAPYVGVNGGGSEQNSDSAYLEVV